ncbi:hypothetical protein L9F63_006158, partial [Diploptera punctata]
FNPQYFHDRCFVVLICLLLFPLLIFPQISARHIVLFFFHFIDHYIWFDEVIQHMITFVTFSADWLCIETISC